MKQYVTLAVALLSIFSYNAYAQHVSTEPQQRAILIEDFTGIRCPNCPDGHRRIDRLQMAQPGKIHCMSIHYGSYATPAEGDMDFRTEDGTAIGEYYKPGSFPSGLVNRYKSPYYDMISGRGEWPSISRELDHMTAPVNIYMYSAYDKATSTLAVDVELCYTGIVEEKQTALCLALTQSRIVGPQAGGGMGDEYVHNHVLRDYITPLWGDTIISPERGKVMTLHYDYKVPEMIGNIPVDPSWLEVIGFVVDNVSHEILNVESGFVDGVTRSWPIKATLEAYKITPSRNYGYNFIECFLKNDGTDPITSASFVVELNGEPAKVEWTGEVAGMSRQYLRLPVDWSDQDSENDYSVSLTAVNGTPCTKQTIKGSFNGMLNVNTDVAMKITTDTEADDNRFLLLDSEANIVAEYGPYADNLVATYDETIHFPSKGIYCLEISDSWGTGILEPRGSVKWYDATNKLIAQNTEIRNFGYRIFFNYTGENTDDGITETTADDASATVKCFNINGQRLSSVESLHGLVIVNGKKVVRM